MAAKGQINLFPKQCSLCGGYVEYIPNYKIYGKRYGSGFCYRCTKCGATVGTHKGRPREAFGILANKEMREKKFSLHELFDPHWDKKSKYYLGTRSDMYGLLACCLGIEQSMCHFGYFDLEMLDKAETVILIWRKMMKDITIKIDAPELAGAINNLANALSSKEVKGTWYPGGCPEDESEKVPIKESVPVEETPIVEDTYVSPADMPSYTQEELRETASTLSKNGKGNDLKKLFNSVGAGKLSEVTTEHSGLVMDRMKELIKAAGLE